MRVDLSAVPPADALDPHLGARFERHCCGTSGVQEGTDNGYRCGLDLNSDGVIDARDRELLVRHAGEVYRMNVGDYGYFGINWLSLGNSPRSRSLGLDPMLYVCAYDYGAGYDARTGVVRLFDSLPPGQRLFMEYFHDVPAAPGKDNVKIYLHPGVDSD
jgi:hypothetical protein